jgi:hypothetical protein
MLRVIGRARGLIVVLNPQDNPEIMSENLLPSFEVPQS